MPKMKRSLIYAAVLATVLIGGSATSFAQVEVTIAPPAPRVEVIPVAPGPADVWVWRPGHWRWNGADYVWQRGHYARRIRAGADWIPGHWDATPSGHYVWVGGHWQ
jgi:hypothetical protein